MPLRFVCRWTTNLQNYKSQNLNDNFPNEKLMLFIVIFFILKSFTLNLLLKIYLKNNTAFSCIDTGFQNFYIMEGCKCFRPLNFGGHFEFCIFKTSICISQYEFWPTLEISVCMAQYVFSILVQVFDDLTLRGKIPGYMMVEWIQFTLKK